ncbi:hypothetical protein [Prauserella muralis]|uniref:hypothetical protein n=1 Tax=Prauserella muralis TaxID=588067 RepID=UPI000DD2ED80|nr:hypothetical protein [Prauserella muralis]TWE27895.1 hypothetical protein FHX69_0544 [Prauserella muralis]
MSTPDDRSGGLPRSGLAPASVAIAAVGLVLAVSTWVAWLLVLPGFRDAQPYGWITVVFALVLGALWFAVLPVGVLAIVFGALALRRGPLTGLARLGIGVGALALLVALGGVAAFVLDATDVPVGPRGPM